MDAVGTVVAEDNITQRGAILDAKYRQLTFSLTNRPMVRDSFSTQARVSSKV